MQSDHNFYCNYVFKHEIIMLEMCFRKKKNLSKYSLEWILSVESRKGNISTLLFKKKIEYIFFLILFYF